MKNLRLQYAEFYITNVCNLTCEGCNRFNNVKFKGWQSWADYAKIYQQWSNELQIDSMTIMGGEPLLNPTIYDWIKGLRELWPRSTVMIVSNGTQLDSHPQLYDVINQDRQITYGVGIHNKMHKQNIINRVERFLKPPFSYNFDSTPYQESLRITDTNGVTIRVAYNWWFHQGAIIKNELGNTLHTSDPEKAHQICHSKTCHHFGHGKLYKCGPVALFPEFDQQFTLNLNEEDRKLMLSYKPLEITDTLETKKAFINGIQNSIPQCKFCPENYNGKQIFAEEKKIVFHRSTI